MHARGKFLCWSPDGQARAGFLQCWPKPSLNSLGGSYDGLLVKAMLSQRLSPEEVAAVPAEAQLCNGGHVHDAVVEQGGQARHPLPDEDHVLVHRAACQLAGQAPHLLGDEVHHLHMAITMSLLYHFGKALAWAGIRSIGGLGYLDTKSDPQSCSQLLLNAPGSWAEAEGGTCCSACCRETVLALHFSVRPLSPWCSLHQSFMLSRLSSDKWMARSGP